MTDGQDIHTQEKPQVTAADAHAAEKQAQETHEAEKCTPAKIDPAVDAVLCEIDGLIADLSKLQDDPHARSDIEALRRIQGIIKSAPTGAPQKNMVGLARQLLDKVRNSDHDEDEDSTPRHRMIVDTETTMHEAQQAKKALAHDLKAASKPSGKPSAASHGAPTATAAAEAARTRQEAARKAKARHGSDEDEDDEAHVEKEGQRVQQQRRRRRAIGGHTPISPGHKRQMDGRIRPNSLIGGLAGSMMSDQANETWAEVDQDIAESQTDEELGANLLKEGKGFERQWLGWTFAEQEIRDALPELSRIGFDKNTWFGWGVNDVVNALVANGAFTGPRPSGFEAGRAWSAENVKRIDMDGNGQISSNELSMALAHPEIALAAARKSNTTIGVAANGNRHFDLNRDGKISIGEFRTASQNAGGKIENSDHNHDGKISNDEMALGLLWLEVREQIHGKPLPKAYDRNNDGRVSVDEVVAVLKVNGIRFDQIDTDAEFAQVIAACAPKAAAPKHGNEELLRRELWKFQGKGVHFDKSFDTNHDGRITIEEVASVLSTRGIKPTQIDTLAELQAMVGPPMHRADPHKGKH